MLLYIIRHPQTEWHLEKRIQGHKDSPLTSLGRDIAGHLWDLLASFGITHIFSSNLGRCVQTAKIIADTIDAPITYHSELRERDFWEYNGKEKSIIRQRMDMNDPELVAPGGESFREMQSRALSFVSTLDASSPESVLIVAHEWSLRALLSDIRKCDPNDHSCDTSVTSVYEFSLDADWLQFIKSIS